MKALENAIIEKAITICESNYLDSSEPIEIKDAIAIILSEHLEDFSLEEVFNLIDRL